MIDLVADWSLVAREPATRPASGVTPANLAYLMYTSGSTGQPKGVMVEHRGVVNHNRAVAQAFGLIPADRVLQFATISFDTAVEEIFPTWASGATLVMRPDGPAPAADEMLDIIESQRISVLDLPTAYWHAWTAELERGARTIPPSLRLVVVGGEAADTGRLTAWRTIAPGVRWLNSYGPTEGTVIASLYEPPRGSTLDPRPVPIGRPIANAQLHVLDRQMQPAPLGVAGELYIGGIGVARGYLNRPELTAERFVHDPFDERRTTNHEPRLYRTGDMARWLPDGTVEFLGRADNQIKLRGFRIELGEIEAALAQHPNVRGAAASARADASGHRRLIGYVVLREAGEQALDALRAWLRSRLPEYMLPAALVPLEALPLTPSGKIDRRALPAPPTEARRIEGERAAQTAAEQTLVEIWKEVLGALHVGVEDNFFALGGDSILGIQVVARAGQAGLRLSPRQLFEAPTVAGLAALAEMGHSIHAEQGVVTGDAPLTPIQRWFAAQAQPQPNHWNQSLLLATPEPLDHAALTQAVAAVLAHHDALRLRLTHNDGMVQSFAGMPSADELADIVRHIVLAGTPEDEQHAAVTKRAAELQASLDLERGPIIRVAAFDLGAGRTGRLLLAIHHMAVDGVSWRVLLEDLHTAYTQIATGAAVRLPRKTTAYRDWARRLAEYASGERVRAELDYWTAAGDTPPILVDFPAGGNREADTASLTVELSAAETQALLGSAKGFGVSVQDALLTALAQALTRWTGGTAALIELEGHGREDVFADVDLSRTVGWFTTTYPLRLDLRGTNGHAEALRAVGGQLRAVPNRGFGYGLLRELGDDEAQTRLRALPQAEVLFNYLGQFDGMLNAAAFAPAPESPGPERDAHSPRSHLIEINGSVAGGQLRLNWSYSAAIHRRETVARVSGDFLAALRGVIDQAEPKTAPAPSDFSLAKLDQKRLDKVLAKFSKKTGK